MEIVEAVFNQTDWECCHLDRREERCILVYQLVDHQLSIVVRRPLHYPNLLAIQLNVDEK